MGSSFSHSSDCAAHTPDNSFLGFVVSSQQLNHSAIVKKNISLVYGKELYMWKEKRAYLDVISRYFDVHATIGNTTQKKQDYDMSIVPGFVYNHGILRAPDLQALLKVGSVSYWFSEVKIASLDIEINSFSTCINLVKPALL